MTLDASTKSVYHVVEFSQILDSGTPSIPTTILRKLYTDSDVNQFFQGEECESKPEIDLRIPKLTGVLRETLPRIILNPGSDTFLSELTSGENIAETKVRIYRVFEKNGSISTRVIAIGEIHQTIANYQKRPGRSAIELRNWKQLIEGFSCGIPCTEQCIWTFRGPGCEVETYSPIGSNFAFGQPIQKTPSTGYQDGAFGLNVWRFTPALLPALFDPEIFISGYLIFEGIRVKIVDIVDLGSDIYDIVLLTEPPKAYIDKDNEDPIDFSTSIIMKAGCNKTKEACEARQNILRFMGVGAVIPAYNPIIEEPE